MSLVLCRSHCLALIVCVRVCAGVPSFVLYVESSQKLQLLSPCFMKIDLVK